MTVWSPKKRASSPPHRSRQQHSRRLHVARWTLSRPSRALYRLCDVASCLRHTAPP